MSNPIGSLVSPTLHLGASGKASTAKGLLESESRSFSLIVFSIDDASAFSRPQ
jgi:hypothetical protein